ncbi:MAG: hypothetical protein FGM15_06155 [Chthoniobacterales bacterium]|nr:hypothetical protein [Chthoniobacterales bacterium]
MKPPILTTTRRQAMATTGLGLFGSSLSSTARAEEPPVAPSPYSPDVRAFGVRKTMRKPPAATKRSFENAEPAPSNP